MARVVVTGGVGFIGSALVRYLLKESPHEVLTLDKLTYAANPASLLEVIDDPRHHFVKADITDAEVVKGIFAEFDPDAVIHLAAETHVDRSIDGPNAFVRTNIVGSYTLLDVAHRHWRALPARRAGRFRFLHVSTDEVFGSLGADGRFSENSRYDPRSPYSASKAASDHLARAWWHTYGLPVIITNCSNNYGPRQFPEKLIPLMIIRALAGDPLPIYGSGENVRDWLYVDDHAAALQRVLDYGIPGETYAVGGSTEKRNIDVVRDLCGLLDESRPRSDGRSYSQQIAFVADRPGHDLRYAIDSSKIKAELGWEPRQTFVSGLERTVLWYLENRSWWKSIIDGRYSGERLGLATASEQQP